MRLGPRTSWASRVVLDANVVVRLVVPGDYREQALALWMAKLARSMRSFSSPLRPDVALRLAAIVTLVVASGVAGGVVVVELIGLN